MQAKHPPRALRGARRERANDEGFLYLFHHVPKSAGSTIEHQLDERFPGKRSITLNFKADTKDEVRARLVRERPRSQELRSIHGHRVFYGLHTVAPDRTPRYFTFLRNPVDRVVSLYNFWADKPERRAVMFRGGELIPFADFIETHAAQNNALRFLANAMDGDRAPGAEVDDACTARIDAAKRFLDACWFVGFAEEFDEDFSVVSSEIGLPPVAEARNVSHPHLDRGILDSTEGRLLELNAADVELYEYARRLRGR